MITYSFDDRGSKTIYEFLYEQIKKDIINHILRPEEKLPSKRALAKHLGISVISVENAYAQLTAEGYIYSIPKSGFYVSELNSSDTHYISKRFSKASFPTNNNYGNNISNINYEIPNNEGDFNEVDLYHDAGSDEYGKASSPSNIIADFVSNSTNSNNFPFSIWAKLLRETMSDDQDKLMQKSPSSGISELRSAIADYLLEFRGLHVSPEQIIVGAGTEYLYGLIIQLLGNTSAYAIEDPGYKKLSKIYSANGVNVKYVPIDNQGIQIESLEQSGADIVHISPSHHFPTGVITSISRRMQLLEWAKASDKRYIIEDDYDSEFRMSGKPVPTLASIDDCEKVIYMNTFSKSLTQTIRISYMVLPPELMRKYNQNFSFYSCTVSTFEQYTLARFIDRGYFEKHINRMRNHYRNTRNQLLKLIKDITGTTKNITEEHAGLHFLLKASTELSDEELIRRAANAGIIISCLSQFFHNPDDSPKHIILINYSGIDIDNIEIAIRKLYECF